MRSETSVGSSGLASHRHLESVTRMQIFLQPPKAEAPSFEVDFQLQQAIAALRRSRIVILGAGRFGGRSVVALQRDTDLPAARAALESARVRISHIDMPNPTSSDLLR